MEKPIKIDYSNQNIPESIDSLMNTCSNYESAAILNRLGIPATDSGFRHRRSERPLPYDTVASLGSKLKAVKIIESMDTTDKNFFLFNIATAIYQESESMGRTAFGMKQSNGVVESVANDFNIDEQVLRRTLRIARAELLFEISRWQEYVNNGTPKYISRNLPNPIDFSIIIEDLAKPLVELVNDHIKLPPSQSRGEYMAALSILNLQNSSTLIPEIYASYYNNNTSGAAIKRLAVYEARMMAKFYEYKIRNNLHSAFDIYLLDRYVRTTRLTDAPSELRNHLNNFALAITEITGIPIHMDDLTAWTGLFLKPSSK